MEFTKGELKYIGTTSLVIIEKKGSRRLSIATVLTEAVDIDTTCKYLVDFQANAAELVRRWNAFEKIEQQRDDLLEALKRISDIEDERYTHGGFDLEVNNISKAAIAKCEA